MKAARPARRLRRAASLSTDYCLLTTAFCLLPPALLQFSAQTEARKLQRTVRRGKHNGRERERGRARGGGYERGGRGGGGAGAAGGGRGRGRGRAARRDHLPRR